MVATLLARSSTRFYRQHPLQLLLAMVGILLGVAIVTAVLITNDSSRRAFALSAEALQGRATHQLQSADGIDQMHYVNLRTEWPDIDFAPIVEGHVVIDQGIFSLLGVDIFAEVPFGRTERTAVADGATAINLPTNAMQLLNGTRVLASQYTMNRLGWQSGQTLTIETATETHKVTLAGGFSTASPAASDGLLIGDISQIQPLLKRGDLLDRIDLIATSSAASALRSSLSDTLRLVDAGAREKTMQAMTRGFQINLTAMSLLALLVGAFLIHNTMTFAVLQRRELFATKRIVGITSRALFITILTEAFVISAFASSLGVIAGFVIAKGLIRLTTQTINDLYFVLHVQEVVLSPWLIAGGLLLGIGTSLLAACIAAWDAAASNPVTARLRSIAETKTRRILPWLAMPGGIAMLCGAALAWLPSQSLVVGFAALLLLIVGYGLILPWFIMHLADGVRPILGKVSVNALMAVGSITRNISRTGLAVAALCIAVSATLGVDVMIGSFRSAVDSWLGNTLSSDIYIIAPATVAARADGHLDSRVRDIALATPGIAAVGSGTSVSVITSIDTLDMLVVEPHPRTQTGFDILSKNIDTAWTTMLSTDAVLVSEPLATKHALKVDDTLQLFTARTGDAPFTVAGIFRDYGSSHGMLVMSRDTYIKHWQSTARSTLGLLLSADASSSQVRKSLTTAFQQIEQPLLIQSHTDIHTNSLAVFDRTFEVTRVLRWLTVGVAFVGARVNSRCIERLAQHAAKLAAWCCGKRSSWERWPAV